MDAVGFQQSRVDKHPLHMRCTGAVEIKSRDLVRACRFSPMTWDRQNHEDLTANNGQLVADGLRREAALPRVDYHIYPDTQDICTSEELRQACANVYTDAEVWDWWENQCLACFDGELIVQTRLKGRR